MAQQSPVAAALIDFDDTLAPSEILWDIAYGLVASEHGKLDWRSSNDWNKLMEFRRATIGKGDPEVTNLFISMFGLEPSDYGVQQEAELYEAVRKEAEQYMGALMGVAYPMEGAREL
ncbi:MAG: hypothetical protein AAB538_01445, partial [Patescibacteria group bacterium]